ncbi:hypothetical protein JSY14_01370 [Brachybacterium sp. EF45031]|uniref:hypothetical protein n=1 Tax=Brachybacterium sillae TaxID=2810536 RepID=UPI00217CFD94|nr:hypothetical protein [Brachybacterium sillae]MCS6710734.1 hypothetical protein [Brachybacterium sillae]
MNTLLMTLFAVSLVGSVAMVILMMVRGGWNRGEDGLAPDGTTLPPDHNRRMAMNWALAGVILVTVVLGLGLLFL